MLQPEEEKRLSAAVGYAAIPAWTHQFWRRLGFGRFYDPSYWEWRGVEPAPGDWWVAGNLISVAVVHVDWRDRIRLLISGRCEIEIASRTDVQVNRVESRSRFAVLAP